MSWELLSTAFVMGLVTGPHCVAMCAAPCAGVCASACSQKQRPVRWLDYLQLNAGRIAGYAVLGALAATTMQAIGWLHWHTAVLKPLWTLAHALVMAWGLMLLILARQPLWADRAGQKALGWMGRLTAHRGGLVAVGSLWALLPCGMLYSALMISALNTQPLMGALSMALFGVGTSVSLLAGASAWSWLRKLKPAVITRMAGALLCTAAGFALFTDLSSKLLALCQ
jgi:sulfite exporter TauE/SafE